MLCLSEVAVLVLRRPDEIIVMPPLHRETTEAVRESVTTNPDLRVGDRREATRFFRTATLFAGRRHFETFSAMSDPNQFGPCDVLGRNQYRSESRLSQSHSCSALTPIDPPWSPSQSIELVRRYSSTGRSTAISRPRRVMTKVCPCAT